MAMFGVDALRVFTLDAESSWMNRVDKVANISKFGESTKNIKVLHPGKSS